MYRFQKETLTESQSSKYILYEKGKQLRYADFIDGLQSDETLRSFFINLLSGIPFRAYQWETPPVSVSSINQPFDFVVTRNPGIDLPPEPGPFVQYFSADNKVAVFDNLGNDAKLIAPQPPVEDLNFSHLGVFTEQAPFNLQHAFWKTVGRITSKQISDEPLWLNTAGGGVAWLHIRLDSRPKYYRHRPYTVFD